MLGGLLSAQECAECRLCCAFEGYDLFETPTVTRETAQRIVNEKLPCQEFVRVGESYLMKMQREPDRDLYYCPLLDRERGCIMGDGKPFECRIWPLRVMRRGERLVIALSALCPVMKLKPPELIRQKCEELAEVIFAEARACPDLVKPYTEGFTVYAEETLSVEGR